MFFLPELLGLPKQEPLECVLYDHRPLALNNDDYERVCEIPQKKVIFHIVQYVFIVWLAQGMPVLIEWSSVESLCSVPTLRFKDFGWGSLAWGFFLGFGLIHLDSISVDWMFKAEQEERTDNQGGEMHLDWSINVFHVHCFLIFTLFECLVRVQISEIFLVFGSVQIRIKIK